MKRLLLILGMIVLFLGTASATDYFVGDSVIYSCNDGESGVAKSIEYARGIYLLPGTDSLIFDSMWYAVRNLADGDDSIWVGVRKTFGNNAPGSSSLMFEITDTITDDNCTLKKQIITGSPKLKGGDTIVFSIGIPSTNGSGGRVAVASNSQSVTGCYYMTGPTSAGGLAANFTCNGGSTWAARKPFTIGVWCHSTTGGGPGGGTGLRVIIQKH